MKIKQIVSAFALMASFLCAQPSLSPTAVLAIGGPAIIAVYPDLPTAKAETLKEIVVMDPVCQAVPQVCVARATMVRYYYVMPDGTFQPAQ